MIRMSSEYQDYLRDESRSTGHAEHIAFPVCEDDVREALGQAAGCRVTVQGARTGLAAGAVPRGGLILNLNKMNKILGLRYDDEKQCFLLRVQPGVLLSQVRRALHDLSFDISNWDEDAKTALSLLRKSGLWFFSPDPTETSATIGGMVACNASGARSFHYGPTRDYVEALRVVFSDTSVADLRRGREMVSSGQFSFQTDSGSIVSGTLPSLPLPQVKNASGYYLQEDMDLLDLFIGSEGTLGVITEVEIRLQPLPASIWGVTVFLPGTGEALGFVQDLRTELSPVAIELFDHRALQLLREQGHAGNLEDDHHTAVYAEFHGNAKEEVRNMVFRSGEIAVRHGAREERTWVATNYHDLERLYLFRHATPETVNSLIDRRRQRDPGITKLGTDMAVPDDELVAIVDLYNRGIKAEGLEAVMFGHIGDNHIHVNILPRSMDDYVRGRQLYHDWAREVIARGGTVSAEHGVGKMKVAMLRDMVGPKGVQMMRDVKRIFDPSGVLCMGNVFDEDVTVGEIS